MNKQGNSQSDQKKETQRVVRLEACGVTATDVRRIVAKLKEEETKHERKHVVAGS